MKQESILKIEITKDEAGQYFAWVSGKLASFEIPKNEKEPTCL